MALKLKARVLPLEVLWFFFLIDPALVMSSSRQLVPPPPANKAPSSPMAAAAPRPAGCLSKCGDKEVPYPFGIGAANCSWKGEFPLYCNHSFSPPRLYAGIFEVYDISLEEGQGRIFGPVWSVCYDSSNTTIAGGGFDGLIFTGTPGLISSTKNEFVAIGCSTVAFDGRELLFRLHLHLPCKRRPPMAPSAQGSAAASRTSHPTSAPYITASSGANGVNNIPVNLAWKYSPCSYAFVAEKKHQRN
ncbi:LOW QUALITY PROTEIN: hypothetical protein U9M48_030433 [Paspalum notatum var. saurae]|uniref:Wall-associated receptor kinase galacturonan-binding domain-containing protein n=1 Tax=Paspalum notatum var. saurae TaxID=547442 RepID=A0AAQ3U5A1_PASNO